MITHKGTKTIKTDRLTLRRYEVSDANQVFNSWGGDPKVAEYMTFTPFVDEEQTRKTLERWVELYSRDNFYLWAIQLGDKVVGNINLVEISDFLESCEVGYCLGADYWGMGIMTEALHAVVDFLFHQVGVHRIEISHVEENPASGRVAEKCGFVPEGVKKEAFKSQNGEFLNLKCYAIINNG